MSTKELLKTTRTILLQHRMPAEALPKVWDNMRASKAELDTMLGLSEANLYRATLPLERSEEEVRKEYPQTYATVGHLLHQAAQAGAAVDLSTISLVNNSVVVKGQPGKMSRLLAKQLQGQESVLKFCMPELKITKPDQFLPKLGDIVRSGRKLFVSTNLLDFLTASGSEDQKRFASFHSCHSLDGCHFNGNLAYARDKMTVITFVTDEKATAAQHELFKLGRSWLFIKGDIIVQPKSYGAYYDFERDAARKFLEEKIAKHFGIPNEFRTVPNQCFDEDAYSFEYPSDCDTGDGALYFDNYAIDISHPVGKSHDDVHLNFAAAMCLECGETTDHQAKGVCSEHDGKVKGTCAVCGQRHFVDQMFSHEGENYCSTCFHARYTQCGHCGQYHPKAQVEQIGGLSVCDKCKKDRYTVCAHCGKFERKDRLDKMKGVGHICGTCRENYMLCGVCGDYHAKDQVDYFPRIGRMCSKCKVEASFSCPDCGEIYLNTDKKGEICCTCVERKAGKVVELVDKPMYADLPDGWTDYIEEVG